MAIFSFKYERRFFVELRVGGLSVGYKDKAGFAIGFPSGASRAVGRGPRKDGTISIVYSSLQQWYEGAGEKKAGLTVTRRMQLRVRQMTASKRIYQFETAEELSGVIRS